MSKFDKIFAARQEPAKTPKQAKSSKATKSTPKVPQVTAAKAKKSLVSTLPPHIAAPAGKRRGRPPAKRSDPNYLGFTTYIHRDVHRRVKMRLLENAEGQELSELVEELLRAWLSRK